MLRADIANIDKSLTHVLDSLIPKSEFLGMVFSFFSLRGYTKIIWVGLFLLVFYAARKKWKELFFDLAASTLATYLIVEFVLKNIVGRNRPDVPLSAIILCPLDFSFPSTHAALAVASAVVIAHHDKKRRFLYYSVAFLISWSRIYLGCHYLFDIAAGGLVGYITARLILRLRSQNPKANPLDK